MSHTPTTVAMREAITALKAARSLITNTCNSGWQVIDANGLAKHLSQALSALNGETQEVSDG